MTSVDYRTYLAANVLSEDKIVTYRLLSRVLKVHVNRAKQMLYEFHRLQNAKKPGSVHATYIVYGIRHKIDLSPFREDGDVVMTSSPPFPSSSAPPANEAFLEDIPVSTMSLVREEHLDILKHKFDSISSIHMHSVGPWQLKDLQVLSDMTREIRLLDADRDLIEYGKIYGTITNPNVKRRSVRRPPPVSAPVQAERANAAPIKSSVSAAKSKAEEGTKRLTQDQTHTSAKQQAKSSQSQAAKDFFLKDLKNTGDQKAVAKKTDTKPPTLKRDSSSIFKAFAKTKPPKLKNDDSDSVTGASGVDSATATDAEDHPMKDVEDDDDEDDDYVITTSTANRKTRKEREADLKAMMDDDDDDDDDEEEEEEENKEEEASETLPDVIRDKSEVGKVVSQAEEKETVSIEAGRRRGRRRVMKKKTMKDDEGYLVTKEEAVWESFSEDEPPAAKPKSAPVFSAAKKGKDSGSKKGQGSIMSFFGKPKK